MKQVILYVHNSYLHQTTSQAIPWHHYKGHVSQPQLRLLIGVAKHVHSNNVQPLLFTVTVNVLSFLIEHIFLFYLIFYPLVNINTLTFIYKNV